MYSDTDSPSDNPMYMRFLEDALELEMKSEMDDFGSEGMPYDSSSEYGGIEVCENLTSYEELSDSEYYDMCEIPEPETPGIKEQKEPIERHIVIGLGNMELEGADDELESLKNILNPIPKDPKPKSKKKTLSIKSMFSKFTFRKSQKKRKLFLNTTKNKI